MKFVNLAASPSIGDDADGPAPPSIKPTHPVFSYEWLADIKDDASGNDIPASTWQPVGKTASTPPPPFDRVIPDSLTNAQEASMYMPRAGDIAFAMVSRP